MMMMEEEEEENQQPKENEEGGEGSCCGKNIKRSFQLKKTHCKPIFLCNRNLCELFLQATNSTGMLHIQNVLNNQKWNSSKAGNLLMTLVSVVHSGKPDDKKEKGGDKADDKVS